MQLRTGGLSESPGEIDAGDPLPSSVVAGKDVTGFTSTPAVYRDVQFQFVAKLHTAGEGARFWHGAAGTICPDQRGGLLSIRRAALKPCAFSAQFWKLRPIRKKAERFIG